MQAYGIPVAQTGAGTLAASTGSTAVTVTPHSGTLAGMSMVVAVCYMAGDPANVVDAGDGWVILSRGYDSGTTSGIFMAACVSPRNGSSGWAGFTLPSSVAWTCQTYTFTVAKEWRWTLLPVMSDGAGTFASGSAQALGAPAANQPFEQVVDLVGRGYNNGGTTTACANIGNYTEMFDTGQTSPPHGVVLSYAFRNGIGTPVSVTSNLTVAKTNRWGVRAMVGLSRGPQRSPHYLNTRGFR
jgi:hypothetical protein